MGFPLPLPVRCKAGGKRKWKRALLPASVAWLGTALKHAPRR